MVEAPRGREASSVGEVLANRSFTSPTPSPSVSVRMSTKATRSGSSPGTGQRVSASTAFHAPRTIHAVHGPGSGTPSGVRPTCSQRVTATACPGLGRAKRMATRRPASSVPAATFPKDAAGSRPGSPTHQSSAMFVVRCISPGVRLGSPCRPGHLGPEAGVPRPTRSLVRSARRRGEAKARRGPRPPLLSPQRIEPQERVSA